MKRLVLPIWLASTALAVYGLHLRYATPVAAPAGARTVPAGTPAPVAHIREVDLTSGVVLVNFWREGCPCSRFVEPEFRAIASEFKSRGLRIITVIDGSSEAWRGRGLPGAFVENEGEIAKQFGVWAAPAAAVVAEGRVVYVGAYNVSRYCDNASTAFARKAVEESLAGRKPAVASTPFFGCALTP